MAASNTFSPDAVLGGPIVHALRGKLCDNFKATPCSINKGQKLYYGIDEDDNSLAFADSDGLARAKLKEYRPVVAAEAVQIYNSETHVSIPVVVAGRCDFEFHNGNTPIISSQSQTFTEENLKFRFIHTGTRAPINKTTTVDVYMEKFGL